MFTYLIFFLLDKPLFFFVPILVIRHHSDFHLVYSDLLLEMGTNCLADQLTLGLVDLNSSWLWDQLTCRAVDLNTSWFGARIWVTLDNVWIGDKLTRVPRIGKSVGFKKRFWSKSDSQRWTEIVGSADLKRVDGDWKWYLNVNEYRIWRIIYRKLQNTTTRGHR